MTVIKEMRDNYIGRRIRLDFTADPYTTLRAGDEGTIDHIDDIGTVFVKWDNGSSLGLVSEAGDKFTFL
jgi:hypothetical protein